jgi:hypothetical protein
MAFMLSIFGEESVSFVTQPEADLAWYTHKAKLQANAGDRVVFVHAEKDITACHHLLFTLHFNS